MLLSDVSRQFVQRLAYVVGLALLAMVLQWLARPFIGDGEPFLFFLPAVALASVWFGRAPGALVLVSGLASAGLDESSMRAFWAEDDGSRITIAVYLIYGVLLIGLGERMRQRTLRASQAQERLRLLAEETDVGLFEIDHAADTAYLSPSLSRLCGVTLPDRAVPVQRWLTQVPTELQAQGRLVLESALSRGVDRFEHELAWNAEAGPRWLLLRVRIIRDEHRVTHVRGAVVDITERKRIEVQLQKTQQELSQQVEDLHLLQELSGRLLESRTLRQQLQLVLDAVVTLHGAEHGVLSLLDPADGALHIEASAGHSPATLERLQALMHASGGTCGMAQLHRERVMVSDFQTDPRCTDLRELAKACGLSASHSTPLISEGGELLGIVSVQFPQPRTITTREADLTDVCARKAIVYTERARAKAELEESQHRFEAVLEASAAPFCVLTPEHDAQGRIQDFVVTYLNTAAAAAVGAVRSRVLHQPLLSLAPDWPQRYAESFAHCVAVVQEHRTRDFELSVMTADGPVTYHCIASPVRGSMALWFSDVSERKRHERQLQDADRRKDEFLATLAHELRNPLAPIRQAALLANAPRATETQKRWSQAVIERQVQHMALLLDDLLDISRITRGALSLRLADVELRAIVDAAVETARPTIDAKAHRLSVQLPDQPVRFEGDALRLAQVVANLLTNAAKYTDTGGDLRLRAWVAAEREATAAGDEAAGNPAVNPAVEATDAATDAATDEIAGGASSQLLIEVSDNGIGIPAASLTEVFNMFTQLRRGADRVNDGLGIGLALTRGLVELHGGTIRAFSDGPGQGSRFVVALPMRDVARADPPAAKPEASIAAPRRILLADDNRDAAESLALLLQMQGHQVKLAFDGEEALAAYARHPAEVCLLDIGMPRLDGNEVARRIRALPGDRRPVLVAITGWGQESDRDDAFAAGFDHHLTKPVDPDKLLTLLGTLGESAVETGSATVTVEHVVLE